MTPSHENALKAARQVAGYYIGDPSWADLLVGAYLDPENALASLKEDQEGTSDEYVNHS